MRDVRKFLIVWITCVLLYSPAGLTWAGEKNPPPNALDIDALFLGPKAENLDFLKSSTGFLLDEHAKWREGFWPQDPPSISPARQSSPDYTATREHVRQVLAELSSKLKKGLTPWQSPRYEGHMNSDTLMPATLAYIAAMLYNPNNVAYEGGPATTEMEIEVGEELTTLLGFDPARSWGHITSGGTVANFEGLWFARNLKSLPLAVKAVQPQLVEGKSDWELLNMTPVEALDLLDKVRSRDLYEETLAATVRGTGVERGKLGKILVPQSRHYSWDKAADIFGIGIENIVLVPVDAKYRMDIDALDRILADLAQKKIAVLMVVSVAGSTEEGTVDETHRITRLRNEWEKKGLSFYYHVDAAWGGYIRSVFLGEDGRFLSRSEVGQAVGEEYAWPDPAVYDAYRAIPEADSVTIDCHKMGYIPYAAGAVVFKDKRILGLASMHAPYVQDLRANPPTSIGGFIMEGSKPGAAAAAVWTAHKVLPLNGSGYGKLVARSLHAAARFHDSMAKMQPLILKNGKKYRLHPLAKPDTNILDWVAMEEGNPDLDAMNSLNQKIYDACSYTSGPMYEKRFLTSKTVFTRKEYGEIPGTFVKTLGLDVKGWEQKGQVMILRSTVMTPFLDAGDSFDAWWNTFLDSMRLVLEDVTAKSAG